MSDVKPYPKYLDKFGALKKNAEAGHYPPDGIMEWHATVFDWLKYMREPRDRFGRRFGVNIFSYYWGECGGFPSFEEAMAEIYDFQIEHKIPPTNYHIHIQYRPKKVSADALQMKLFTSYEMENL